jgi:hypothetical protein
MKPLPKWGMILMTTVNIALSRAGGLGRRRVVGVHRSPRAGRRRRCTGCHRDRRDVHAARKSLSFPDFRSPSGSPGDEDRGPRQRTADRPVRTILAPPIRSVAIIRPRPGRAMVRSGNGVAFLPAIDVPEACPGPCGESRTLRSDRRAQSFVPGACLIRFNIIFSLPVAHGLSELLRMIQ